MRRNYTLEHRRIEQSLVPPCGADRRMMNQDHAEHIFGLEFVQYGGQLGELFRAEPAGRQERCGWHTG